MNLRRVEILFISTKGMSFDDMNTISTLTMRYSFAIGSPLYSRWAEGAVKDAVDASAAFKFQIKDDEIFFYVNFFPLFFFGDVLLSTTISTSSTTRKYFQRSQARDEWLWG